jgi:hypothetical protein
MKLRPPLHRGVVCAIVGAPPNAVKEGPAAIGSVWIFVVRRSPFDKLRTNGNTVRLFD